MTLAEFELLSFAERRAVVKRLLAKERAMARKAAAAAGADLPPDEEAGCWTFHRPDQPGYYFVADREGNARGIRQLVYRTMPNGRRLLCEAGIPHNEPGWAGYFWSQPIEMPPAKSEEPS